MNRNIVEEMRDALKRADAMMSPREHFAHMVKRGLINSKGELTKKYGGTAEVEVGEVEAGCDADLQHPQK
ncbi:hypothetical protein [Planctomicrobium piriforme]|uniref:Uncharacterized protein n=1 Tax=Planctomicrobium piriforme TaxID=1576369 RepID=A0A1I3KU90_9PLAN|nr:hypothetical protein [Planctomicrobium piriforme]SFI76079.1 hypothetical protein SAMN05421753_11247 [Planctomicrobium piriforme]